MQSNLSNLMKFAVVVLPMMIALTVFANAQTAKHVGGRVVGGVITVVKSGGTMLQSNDGGKNWESFNAEQSEEMAATIEAAKAKRQRLLAQVSGTVANPTTAGANLMTDSNVECEQFVRQTEGVQQTNIIPITFDAAGNPSLVSTHRCGR